MAEKILLKNEKTNEEKESYVGFSWTFFFFTCFVPLIRGDVKGFFITLGIEFIIHLITPFITLFYRIGFASWYNKSYTENLIKKGFRPIDEEGEKLLKKYGINY